MGGIEFIGTLRGKKEQRRAEIRYKKRSGEEKDHECYRENA